MSPLTKITDDKETGKNYQVRVEYQDIPIEITKNNDGYYMRVNEDDLKIEASEDDRWLFSRMLDRIWSILESRK